MKNHKLTESILALVAIAVIAVPGSVFPQTDPRNSSLMPRPLSN